jgi:uncharacterized cofD-like protein
MTPTSQAAGANTTLRSDGLWEPARHDLRVVALGGGTGLPTVLRGLRTSLFGSRPWEPERDQTRLTAIATVADDGGSSGMLRAVYDLPSPGDIRNCLVALAAGDPEMAALFDYRFGRGSEIAGHSLGNLILTALTELEQDFSRAIARVGRMLSIRGRVLPSTTRNVVLRAELSDGRVIEGESRIAGARSTVRRLRLHPDDAAAPPEALEAIARADLIVIGPGSLYSSLVAVLLVRGLAEAIAGARARVVLVMNLMTEPGETDGHTATDHLLALHRHAPTVPIHDVLVNTAPLAPELVARYASLGATPVPADVEGLKALGQTIVEGDLLATGDGVRHDPDKLGPALLARVTQAGG